MKNPTVGDVAYAISEMDQYRLEMAARTLETMADLTGGLDSHMPPTFSPECLSPVFRLVSLVVGDIAEKAGSMTLQREPHWP